ncbi:MAG: hypothetical protein ACXABG_01910 [Promethearchaeota archaeon]|jgi:uncharacterized membrane protein
MRDETKFSLVCYLVIGIIAGVFLLAGGWRLVLMLFFAYAHG